MTSMFDHEFTAYRNPNEVTLFANTTGPYPRIAVSDQKGVFISLTKTDQMRELAHWLLLQADKLDLERPAKAKAKAEAESEAESEAKGGEYVRPDYSAAQAIEVPHTIYFDDCHLEDEP